MNALQYIPPEEIEEVTRVAISLYEIDQQRKSVLDAAREMGVTEVHYGQAAILLHKQKRFLSHRKKRARATLFNYILVTWALTSTGLCFWSGMQRIQERRHRPQTRIGASLSTQESIRHHR